MELDEKNEEVKSTELQVEVGSSTLLPTPIASAVSLIARSSSLYLRLGTFIGGLAIDGARVTTLTGLELSRAVIEGILSRAGRDVAIRSTGELNKAEAEGILERWIATLHSTITNVSFAVATTFHFSTTALNSTSDASQQLLATLDGILGSTDSSRAIASIITLIRREFQNPATGREGERVGVLDLLLGISGLALLQRWCKKILEEEEREKKTEETVWDVVILNDGRRADFVGSIEDMKVDESLARVDSMSFMTTDGDELVHTFGSAGKCSEDSDEDLPEIVLKQRIMSSLPTDTSVSITTKTTTTKTITVEIMGPLPQDLSPPPGVEIVEEAHIDATDHGPECPSNNDTATRALSKHRVVYRIVRNRLRGTDGDAKTFLERSDSPLSEFRMDVSKDGRHSPILTASPILSLEAKTPPLPPEPPQKDAIYDVLSCQPLNKHNGQRLDETKLRASTANQGRSRKPTGITSTSSRSKGPPPEKVIILKSPPMKKTDRPPSKPSEKKGSFRNALRKGSGTTLTSLWTKDSSVSPISNALFVASSTTPQIPVRRSSDIIPSKDVARAARNDDSEYLSAYDLGISQSGAAHSPSRTNYYSVCQHRHDSIVSQTDTYSIHSTDTRPGSPTTFRTHLRAQSSMVRAKSEKSLAEQPESANNHRRSKSHVPSIYTLNNNNSAISLVLNNEARGGAIENAETIAALIHTGLIKGMFPQHHIVRNITRYIRFASASYGASFLRVMGISTSRTAAEIQDTSHHHEHHSFSTHTQLPPSTILLSSFVDPQGGTDSTGNTNTGVPMVHFVSLDHESKAVVLTCRGTLGFEDVLTDMTCDYDELKYRGKSYKVHKGIHASARRLLDGGGGRVMTTIAAALEEFPDYGFVMCGHSLGGGVTALLAILISEPSSDPTSTSFFTTNYSPQLLLTSSSSSKDVRAPTRISLPAGRQIHVYAYGPPATLSPSLRLATRGLITTIINGQDLVPYLSLGVLHDFQAVALAFKTDDTGAKSEVRKRVWEGITGTFADKWNIALPPALENNIEDEWAFSALKTLRASMLSSKLVPPGEVFVVETTPVLQRDAFVKRENGSKGLGMPATRCVLKYIQDVERKFGEVRFGGSMLLDHSPGRYEWNLAALGKGVLG